MSPRELPLFPLGAALLPTMHLPLRVFEPRYLQMLADIQSATQADEPPQFGVVQIKRGSEVGPTNQKFDIARSRIGTFAELLHSENGPGQLQIVARGTVRFRVLDWLVDNPYPRALVQSWPDDPALGAQESELPKLTMPELLQQNRDELGSFAAMIRRAGHDVPELPAAETDPSRECFQLCSIAPLQSFDKQRLLEVPDARSRLSLLSLLVSEARSLYQLQLDSS